MIAKATPKGKSFKAILNYIYKGKLDNRGKSQKKPEVVSYSNNIEIPLNEDDLESLDRLTKNFHNQAKSHKDFDHSKPYVGHHILSFGKEDMMALNKLQIADIVNQYIQDAELKNTQYIAVSHHDTDVFHVHLVFNRCMNNGKIYDDWRERMKACEKAVALNLKYDLPLLGRQVDIAKTSAVWEIRVQHDDIQELIKDPLLKDMRNLHHFKKVAEKESRILSEDEKNIEVDGKKYRKMI